jgi:hypothetical protein
VTATAPTETVEVAEPVVVAVVVVAEILATNRPKTKRIVQCSFGWNVTSSDCEDEEERPEFVLLRCQACPGPRKKKEFAFWAVEDGAELDCECPKVRLTEERLSDWLLTLDRSEWTTEAMIEEPSNRKWSTDCVAD